MYSLFPAQETVHFEDRLIDAPLVGVGEEELEGHQDDVRIHEVLDLHPLQGGQIVDLHLRFNS